MRHRMTDLNTGLGNSEPEKLINNGKLTNKKFWVCPKCGTVMSPDQPYCLFCKPVDTRVEVTTTGIMSTINTENKSISKGE